MLVDINFDSRSAQSRAGRQDIYEEKLLFSGPLQSVSGAVVIDLKSDG
jgi:hypothetical protein